MRSYVLRRCLQVGVVLVAVSVVVFLSMHLIPGDPAAMAAGAQASWEDIEAMRRKLGLDQPLHVQYLRYVWKALHGDLGWSFRGSRPVAADLRVAFPVTMQLSLGALCLAILLGIPTGVVTAVRRGSLVDVVLSALSVLCISMPVYWFGLILILVFAVWLGVLPSAGWGSLKQSILPTFCLSLSTIALLTRMTRATMVETLLQDYVRTARAKGLHERVVVYRHALRNALIPVVTVLGLRLGVLIGGAVITETVFGIPGIGRLVVEAVGFRDIPVVQGGVMVIALSVGVINLAVDLAYALVDPRVRLG